MGASSGGALDPLASPPVLDPTGRAARDGTNTVADLIPGTRVIVKEGGLVASFLYHRLRTLSSGAEGIIVKAGIDDHFVIEFQSGPVWVPMQKSNALEVSASVLKSIQMADGDLDIPPDDDIELSTSATDSPNAGTSQASGEFAQCYDIEIDLLGKGALAVVYKARSRCTNAEYAVKHGKVESSRDFKFAMREIDILRSVDHPNIVQYHQHFLEGNNLYLVLAYCEGEDLWDRLKGKDHFSEKETALLMQQVLRAVFYLHENLIVHRDLKPENLIFETRDALQESNLQLLDFNLARRFHPGEVLLSKVGTPYYMSPETLRGRYDHRSDLWSVGVLMYFLLAGYKPFTGGDEEELCLKVKQANYSMQRSPWTTVSKAAKEMIRSLLKVDAARRMTASIALDDPWLRGNSQRVSGSRRI
jgi:tRNA A-37 threonylcarbamoyl transferase component Bud32